MNPWLIFGILGYSPADPFAFKLFEENLPVAS